MNTGARAVHHSDKSPIKGVYSSQPALKMLEIHQVFLRFLPCLAEISALYRCEAVLKQKLFLKTNKKIPGMLTHFGNFLVQYWGKRDGSKPFYHYGAPPKLLPCFLLGKEETTGKSVISIDETMLSR